LATPSTTAEEEEEEGEAVAATAGLGFNGGLAVPEFVGDVGDAEEGCVGAEDSGPPTALTREANESLSATAAVIELALGRKRRGEAVGRGTGGL